jgi:RNA polymerase sigma factor (sigma-70 family)
MATTNRLLQLARDAAPAATDGDLLRCFVESRDEAAFAEVVRRNGPLVLRVCRSVLGEASAAEDAFQAVFLALAQKARHLTASGSVAGWLHVVAVRTARHARRREARHRTRETAHETPQTTAPADLAWSEVRRVLDAELAALPEKYRAPLVLCYLQELTYEEAARRAGCSLGTLRGRLERGKELLRKRLAKFGLPLAAPILVLGAPEPVSAAIEQTTLDTVRAMVSGGRVPSAVAALAGTRTTFRAAILAPVAVALVVVGAVLAAGAFPRADPPKADPPKPAEKAEAVVPQPPTDRLGDPLPAGAVARLGTRRLFGPREPRWAAYSHDGSKLAARSYYGITVCDAATGRLLVERNNYWTIGGAIGWRADGTGVAVVRLPDRSLFVSAFTDAAEKLPNPPLVNAPDGREGPDGLEFVALAPDAAHFAVVRDPDAMRFTIDILPATVGKPVSALKPVKTLGPFDGPCREVRYTSRGALFLTGSWKEQTDWTMSIVNHDKNAIARAITIPPPAYCVWGFMYSLSPDARLAAIPLRPRPEKPGGHTTNQHTGTIHLWDLETGKELHALPFKESGYGTGHAFTPDGKTFITSGEKPYFRIWEVPSAKPEGVVATGKEAARAPQRFDVSIHWEASSIAVSPDGKRFATGRRDGRIDIWDTATAEVRVPLDTHRHEVATVAVSPDGKLAATLGHDSAIRVWELANGKPVVTISAPRANANPHAGPKRRPAFIPDGRGLIFTSGTGLVMVDPLTGKPLELPGALRGAKAVVSGFSVDGKTLVTIDKDTVTLWDWPAGASRLTVTVPLAERKSDDPKVPEVVRVDYAARLSPDGRFLFTNSVRDPKDKPEAGGVQNANDVWDARTGKHLHRLEKPEPWYPPAGFSPDGRLMYLGGHSPDWPERGRSRADALTVWDPVAGKLLRRLIEPDRTGQPVYAQDFGRKVQALAVSPDGRLLAAAEGIGSSRNVWVYETASGRVLKKLAGHDDEVNDLAFSPDGRRLVSGSRDQTGLVWDVTLSALVSRSGKPTEQELSDAWERLGGSDPGLGYLGIAALTAAPAEAGALLKAKLRPALVPTDADLDRVTAKLGAAESDDREKASAELESFGAHAVAGAKARLKTAESPEVRDRLTRFLGRFDGPHPTPYELRSVRGVAALEAIGTPEAKALLGELAKGKGEDALAREAAGALRRLTNR